MISDDLNTGLLHHEQDQQTQHQNQTGLRFPLPCLPQISIKRQLDYIKIMSLSLAATLAFFLITGFVDSAPAAIPESNKDNTNAKDASSSAEYSFDGQIVHYPVTENEFSNLDAVFNASQGTNNGIYNSSTSPIYGLYNFCNEPHVRSDIYPTVDSKYKLQYVEVVHRHHKRSPYSSNTFPEEQLGVYCTNDTVNGGSTAIHGASFANSSLAVNWHPYLDPTNPFSRQAPYFDQGLTCQLPQLTTSGLQDSLQHGKDLYDVYSSKLGFLPAQYDPEQIKFRVTNNVITSQVASALIHGMFPELNESVDTLIQVDGYDSLEPSFDCPFADNLKKQITGSDGWNEHLNRSKSLFNELDTITGVDPESSDWHISFDHYFDNTAYRLCHGAPLVCNDTESQENCMTMDQAEQIFRLGDWEYNYLWRGHDNSTLMAATRYGAWFHELKHHLIGVRDTISSGNTAATTESAITSTTSSDDIKSTPTTEAGIDSSKLSKQTRYFHNVAHDGSVSAILSFLNINFMRWPGMGSEVVFELYSSESDNNKLNWFIRVLHSSTIIESNSPLGKLDMIPLNDFVTYIEKMVGADGELVYKYCTSDDE
ncbi:unnamed protein product [Ambrosiozyma monospora]|uniref:Unnamed protein product n=1 Tax=Ambrosiozyma monospora TaxID=43982 RepID=A0ACB5SSV4_AMBMO|nr:unnamed protein product [Ambrosiozyma monospora]